MPQTALNGEYYEFSRSRPGMELGRTVAYSQAMILVRGGRDIYTPNKEDAYKIARSVTTPAAYIQSTIRMIPKPLGKRVKDLDTFSSIFAVDYSFPSIPASLGR